MRKERCPPVTVTGPKIGRVILIDREVDLVTPMMTQITFEGLIDEVTGIRHGSVPLASPAGGWAVRLYTCWLVAGGGAPGWLVRLKLIGARSITIALWCFVYHLYNVQ